MPSVTLRNALLCSLGVAQALVLNSSLLSVLVDDSFPRPLNYTLTATGEALQGALTGWGFHILLQLNKGQGTCGEAGMDIAYTANPSPPGSDSRAYTLTAACAVNWLADGGDSRQMKKARGSAAFFTLNMTGTVSVYDDPAVPGAGVFSFVISAAIVSPPDALGAYGLRTIDIAGYEALSLRALPPVPGCFYTPDMNGVGEKVLVRRVAMASLHVAPPFCVQPRRAAATTTSSTTGSTMRSTSGGAPRGTRVSAPPCGASAARDLMPCCFNCSIVLPATLRHAYL